MYLKSLEINGFKSFAKKGFLEFKTPITSIVGPNGSGKSNVAEAFRFVLGEQSIKSMRGKRGEDLIFNGSNEVPKMSRASVKVVFDNSTRFLDIDFDDVEIQRVVHRDGSNEYHINGTLVRLKDITELLAKANIGSTGHHIISQGEADRILSANPKDRKSMIEDALGLRVYQYKITESEKKQKKTSENIREVELLRKEIAPHLRFLQKQVEKIEKARELRDELKEMYQEYLKRESVYLEYEEKNIGEKKHIPVERLKVLDAELVQATSQLEESVGGDEKSAELLSLERELRDARTEKDTLLRELGRIEGEISSQERGLVRQKEHFADGKPIPFSELQQFSEKIRQQIDTVESTDDMSIIKQVLKMVRDNFSNFVRNFQDAEEDSLVKEIEDEIKELQTKKHTLELSRGSLIEKEISLNGRYDVLQQEIEKEKDSSREAETSVFRIRAERNEVLSVLSQLQYRETVFLKDKDAFSEELKEGGVLIGLEITSFKEYVILGDTGEQITNEILLSEEREKQEERRRKIEKSKIRLEDMGGGSSDEVMKEFQDVTEREAYLLRELEDLKNTEESLSDLISDLIIQLDTEFKAGISKINKEFQNYFSLMFGGGTASLSVVRAVKRRRSDLGGLDEGSVLDMEEEEGEDGIEITVSLPRKKVKSLMILSGGERALTSIALLFAMSQVTPPPFIILDETDAALDEANSRKYGDMIENLSAHSQLILITHNRETMSRAGILYGVTMGSGGISKLLSVELDEAVVVAK